MNENGLGVSLHGGGPAKPRSGKPHDAYRTVLAEGLPRGFRHFALKGRFRSAATGNRQVMAERYARLAVRMTARVDWEKVPSRQPGALLRDDIWQNEVMLWLRPADFQGGPRPWDGSPEEIQEDDLAALSIDPPVLFFLLFEACRDRESLGCCLGRFGSIVVADPLFAELNNRLQSERLHGSLAEQLRSVHPAFGDRDFDRPTTMATVICFIDRHLQASSDPAMRYPSLL
jgi:hypothetical protein